MDSAQIKDKIHKYLDTADNSQLNELYEFIEEIKYLNNTEIYDEATMNLLLQRRENHRKRLTKSYSAEEVMNMIRQPKK